MSEPIRVLELRSVRGTGGGPEKTILLGAARADRARFAVTVCYIRDKRDTVFGIDGKAAGLPIDYVELVERHSFDPGLWKQLRALVRERRIDIVHAHEYKTDLLTWTLGKFERVIPLSTAHGWTGHSTREHRLYYPIDKRILGRFPRVIAVSSEIRNVLLRHGASPSRVTTVLNGIDPAAFHRERTRERFVRSQLGLTDDDFVIGSVGRLEPQKRFDLLIDAVAQLAPSCPHLKVLIVGDGSLQSTLREQIARLGVAPRCWLLGQRADISDLHHAFDLYVQSSDYEGTPNAVLEAMALETPVVATDVGGTAELIRHGTDGLVVPPASLPALLDAVRAAMGDPKGMTARSASARRRVETDLSFETRMRTVEAIYSELMQERTGKKAPSPVAART